MLLLRVQFRITTLFEKSFGSKLCSCGPQPLTTLFERLFSKRASKLFSKRYDDQRGFARARHEAADSEHLSRIFHDGKRAETASHSGFRV